MVCTKRLLKILFKFVAYCQTNLLLKSKQWIRKRTLIPLVVSKSVQKMKQKVVSPQKWDINNWSLQGCLISHTGARCWSGMTTLSCPLILQIGRILLVPSLEVNCKMLSDTKMLEALSRHGRGFKEPVPVKVLKLCDRLNKCLVTKRDYSKYYTLFDKINRS